MNSHHSHSCTLSIFSLRHLRASKLLVSPTVLLGSLLMTLWGAPHALEAIRWEEFKMGLVSHSLPHRGKMECAYDKEGRILRKTLSYDTLDRPLATDPLLSKEDLKQSSWKSYATEEHSYARNYKQQGKQWIIDPNPLFKKSYASFNQDAPDLSKQSCSYDICNQHNGTYYTCSQKMGNQWLRLTKKHSSKGVLSSLELRKSEPNRTFLDFSGKLILKEQYYYDRDLPSLRITVRFDKEGKKATTQRHFIAHQEGRPCIKDVKNDLDAPLREIITERSVEGSKFFSKHVCKDYENNKKWTYVIIENRPGPGELHFYEGEALVWKAYVEAKTPPGGQSTLLSINIYDGEERFCGLILKERRPIGKGGNKVLHKMEYAIKEALFPYLSPLIWQNCALLGADLNEEEVFFPYLPTFERP